METSFFQMTTAFRSLCEVEDFDAEIECPVAGVRSTHRCRTRRLQPNNQASGFFEPERLAKVITLEQCVLFFPVAYLHGGIKNSC